jgi:hypothetical protein
MATEKWQQTLKRTQDDFERLQAKDAALNEGKVVADIDKVLNSKPALHIRAHDRASKFGLDDDVRPTDDGEIDGAEVEELTEQPASSRRPPSRPLSKTSKSFIPQASPSTGSKTTQSTPSRRLKGETSIPVKKATPTRTAQPAQREPDLESYYRNATSSTPEQGHEITFVNPMNDPLELAPETADR